MSIFKSLTRNFQSLVLKYKMEVKKKVVGKGRFFKLLSKILNFQTDFQVN